jgi:NADH-quinone oxidoreductase subunit C
MEKALAVAPTEARCETIVARLRARFPDLECRIADSGVPAIVVPAGRIAEICRYLKDEPDLAFDYLASVTAIDFVDRMDIVYQMRSLANAIDDVALRVEIDRDASLPSVTSVWRAADFQEREIYDLMGIRFDGHPDLRRILLYDEFDGHPLRKDWRLPAEPRELGDVDD